MNVKRDSSAFEFIVDESRLKWRDSGELATVREFSDYEQQRPFDASAPLRLVGRAHPVLRIRMGPAIQPTFNLSAQSGPYRFPWPNGLSAGWDHLCFEDKVAPIDIEDFLRCISALESNGLGPGEELNLKDIATLVRLHTSYNWRLEVADDVFDFLDRPVQADVISSLKTELYDYQLEGFRWLVATNELGLGAILADEMGVGKTIQILALIDFWRVSKTSIAPSLVVVPNILLLNWCKEIVRHAPGLVANTHVHHGGRRSVDERFLSSFNVILTTYDLLLQDRELLGKISYQSVICDEAHMMKNPRTLRSQVLKSLRAVTKIALTGTPVQNRLLDYWNLFDFVDAGLLGSAEHFERACSNSLAEAEMLSNLVRHRVLRRTQESAGLALPETITRLVPLSLTEQQQEAYYKIEQEARASSQVASGFGTLVAKRQFCAYPTPESKHSSLIADQKSEYLIFELEKVQEVQQKAIIFVADFNGPRDAYKRLITSRFSNLFIAQIDGRTDARIRHPLIDAFSAHDGFGVLLMNPDVGGVGLTIVAANHVFHMNPAWNPSKTDQATFRVVRPGQTRTTYTHHLYWQGTIEEAIVEAAQAKRDLSAVALASAEEELAKRNFRSMLSSQEKL